MISIPGFCLHRNDDWRERRYRLAGSPHGRTGLSLFLRPPKEGLGVVVTPGFLRAALTRLADRTTRAVVHPY